MSSFPLTTRLDHFNRPNEGPPPTGWEEESPSIPTMKIANNQMVPEAATADYYDCLFLTLSTGTDWEYWYTVVTVDTNQEAAMLVIVPSGSGSGYEAFWYLDGNVYIRRWDSGTPTTLGAPIASTLSNGDQIGIRKVGSTISAWKNGVEVGNRTDATYSSTGAQAFIYARSDNGLWAIDDFGGGSGVSLGGTLTFSGGLTKNTNKMLSGVLSFAGSVLTSFTQLVSVGGTLTFSGGVTKNVGKQLGGVLSFIGTVVTAIKHGFSVVSSGTGTFGTVSDNDTDDFTEVN